MDCVTCMLMGMCMLCTSDMSASEPGRPMTRAEVDQAVVRVVHRFQQAAEKEQRDRKHRELQEVRGDSYERRQSFYDDPRYSYSGIGKRNSAPIEYPSSSVSKIISNLEENILPKYTGGKVLLLYPSHNNRKLTIERVILPSRTRKDQLKEHLSQELTSKVKESKSDMNVKRGTGLKRLPTGSNKKMRFSNFIFKFGIGLKNRSHIKGIGFTNFLNRNPFKATFQRTERGVKNSEKLIPILSNRVENQKMACY